MTQPELRNRIIKRYRPNQIVNMRLRAMDSGRIIERFKAEIIKFYPYHVSCKVNGYIESYSYWDMVMLTTIKRGDGD